MTTDSASKFEDATMCRIIRESLEGLLTKLTPAFKPVRVKEARFDDTTVLVDFYAASRDSMSVKNEIAAITGALSGLLKTNELTERPVLHYGIRAWENDQSWLTYAICSAETASKMGEGHALDWLRGTEFQENTADWRLARAKALTSRVEIGLRDVIDHVLNQAVGPSWWLSVMVGDLTEIRRAAERQARRDGATDPSPRELLNYTYLRDLTPIVLDTWMHLGSMWRSRDIFAKRMKRLNMLRRPEAHNRPIAGHELAELESLHDQMLDDIAGICPEVVPSYLTEKWCLSLLRVAEKLRDSWGPGEVRSDIAENAARLAAFQRLAERSVHELEQIQVPPGKGQLHEQLLEAVRLAAVSSERMLDALNPLDIKALEEAFEQFRRAMQHMREFEERFLLAY